MGAEQVRKIKSAQIFAFIVFNSVEIQVECLLAFEKWFGARAIAIISALLRNVPRRAYELV